MDLTMLGTGHACVTECYNTCFVLSDDDGCLMVDGGGGYVARQLKHAGFDWRDMHDIFVTHKHLDHLTGVVWMIRLICQNMNHGRFEGDARIYAHDEVVSILREAADRLLQPAETRFIDDRLHLIEVQDGETHTICHRPMTFFDIHSTKAKQFGFKLALPNGERMVCCGDEPSNPETLAYAEGCEWMLHEAFCLDAQSDLYHPHKICHSTVKDACEQAEALHVRNLVLYHTEDSDMEHRKARYTQEGKRFFSGSLFVPDDLETIQITD